MSTYTVYRGVFLIERRKTTGVGSLYENKVNMFYIHGSRNASFPRLWYDTQYVLMVLAPKPQQFKLFTLFLY